MPSNKRSAKRKRQIPDDSNQAKLASFGFNKVDGNRPDFGNDDERPFKRMWSTLPNPDYSNTLGNENSAQRYAAFAAGATSAKDVPGIRDTNISPWISKKRPRLEDLTPPVLKRQTANGRAVIDLVANNYEDDRKLPPKKKMKKNCFEKKVEDEPKAIKRTASGRIVQLVETNDEFLARVHSRLHLEQAHLGFDVSDVESSDTASVADDRSVDLEDSKCSQYELRQRKLDKDFIASDDESVNSGYDSDSESEYHGSDATVGTQESNETTDDKIASHSANKNMSPNQDESNDDIAVVVDKQNSIVKLLGQLHQLGQQQAKQQQEQNAIGNSSKEQYNVIFEEKFKL